MSDGLINGVPADQYGVWCQHGKRVMVPNPEPIDARYPGTVIADPWPCTECTAEQLIANIEAEQGAYLEDQWENWRATQ